MDEPAQPAELPLFARVLASVAAHLLGALAGLFVHWLVRGWLERDQVAQGCMVALTVGCAVAGAEALARARWRVAALLTGALAGPAAAFGATFLTLRLRSSWLVALDRSGAALTATPAALLSAGIAVLFSAAWIGPLVHHRLRGHPPSTQVAGMALALIAGALALVPPGLGEPLWRWNVWERLAEMGPWLAAVAIVPRVMTPAETGARWLAGLVGVAPESPLPLSAWASGLRAACPGLRSGFPGEGIGRRAREAARGQEVVLGFAAVLLVAAGVLELVVWQARSHHPAGVARLLAWVGSPALDGRESLAIARGAVLPSTLAAALLLGRLLGRPGLPQAAAWAALGCAFHVGLLVGVGDVVPAMVGASLLLAAVLAALAAGIIPLELGIPLACVVPAIGAYEHVFAAHVGLLTTVILPGAPEGFGAALAWGLGALLVIVTWGWRWRVPPGRMVASGAGAVAAGALVTRPTWDALRAEGWWILPFDLWTITLAAGLAGGFAGALLARRLPRVGPALALGLTATALVVAAPGQVPHQSAELEALRERAARGEPLVMLELGRRLAFGVRGLADTAEGGEWIRRAAEAGHPEAMHRWGCLLTRRWWVRNDRAAARRWIEAAAAAGLPEARERLAWDPELREAGPGIDAAARSAVR